MYGLGPWHNKSCNTAETRLARRMGCNVRAFWAGDDKVGCYDQSEPLGAHFTIAYESNVSVMFV